MLFKRKGAICFALAAGLAIPAVGQTLPDALAASYRNSSVLESSRALLRVSDETVSQAVAVLRPAINLVATSQGRVVDSASAQSGDSLTGTLRLTMDLLLSDGGSQRLAIKAAEEGVLAARQTLVETEQNVILGAVRAYYDVLRYDRLLTLERNNHRLISTELDAARNRFQLGAITRTDVSAVEAQLASARSTVALREGELSIARETYRLQVGEYPGTLEFSPLIVELPPSLEEATEIARRNHPSIIRAQHTAAAADLNVKRSETVLNPRISLGGSVALDRNLERWSGSGSTTSSISLTANMPLYRGGTNMALLRQGLAVSQQARFDLLQAVRSAEQRVASAWARFEIAAASITARREQVESAQIAYNGMREEAALGLRSTLDVLDTEQRLLGARTDLITAETNRDVAAYSLIASMGRLTAAELGLEVNLYDPQVNYERVKTAPVASERRMLLDKVLKRSGR